MRAVVLLLAGAICVGLVGGCSVRPSTASAPPDGASGRRVQAWPGLSALQERLLTDLVQRMSVSELAGQMIMVSLEQDDWGAAVLALGDAEKQLLRAVRPGGVILFGPNLDTVDQIHALVYDLQQTAQIPLIIATDHEGGLVSRLTASGRMNATVMPSETLVGIAAEVLAGRGERERATELARRWGNAIGAELKALGITMNMAPVADVDRAAAPGLLAQQRRTFGADAVLVGELTAAAVRGLHTAGVTAVLKHFPGQGAATLDSHTDAVSLAVSVDTLNAVDLVPFVAGIDAGARAIMSSHISYPEVTGTNLPATVSADLITDLLRGELGFRGVIITDALNMDAVSLGREPAELALAAIHAGADIILKPLDPLEIHGALVDAVFSGKVTRARLEESVFRIARMKLQSGLLGPAAIRVGPRAAEVLGSPEHLALVEEIRAVARSRRE